MFYSKYNAYAQEAHEQIDQAAFKGVFLTLFHKNTGLKSLFNIKLCIRFDIDRVYLSGLIININTLKKYFFVCDDHSFEYASNAHSFNNL